MPDRLATRLAAELDALTPRAPEPAQARYRASALTPRPLARLGLQALVVAAASLLVTAVGTLATGSPNPQVWSMQVAGGLHRLQEPDAEPSRTPAGPAESPPAAPVIPAPAASAPGRRDVPPSKPKATPEAQGSPGSHEQRPPTPTAEPSEDPRDGERRGNPGASPRPSASPSDR